MITISGLSDGTYRYAAWKANQTISDKPEIVITGGYNDGDYYVFHNKGYDYYVDDNEVKATKGGKIVGSWEKITL